MKKFPLRALITGLVATLLVACGGGSDSAPAATATISGIAATGAAIAGGSVSMNCVSGVTGTTSTATDGSFVMSVSGITFPCVARVDYRDAAGNAQKLHSFTAAIGNLNITPLTELLVASLTGGDPAAAFDRFDATKAKAFTALQIKTAADTVKAYLRTLGVDTSTLPDDLIGIKFVAKAGATAGDAFDKVLDDVKVKLIAAGLSLSAASGKVVTGGSNVTGSTAGTTTGTTGATATTTGTTTSSAPKIGTTTTTTVTPSVAFLVGGSIQSAALNVGSLLSRLTLRYPVGPAIQSQGLEYPASITTDGTYLYLAEKYYIHQIEIATGFDIVLAGRGSPNTFGGSADGTGSAATIANPEGITTDGINLYVAEPGDSRIRKIVIATGAVSTFAGTSGVQGAADGTGTAATFYLPRGITTDGANLYVADSGNNNIRKIVIATQVVTTLAGYQGGAQGFNGYLDATGTAAKFNGPTSVTTDGTNLYVTDSFNHSIRKIAIATGAVTTLAGWTSALSFGATPVSGATDATGTSARFNYPTGITSDGTNVYVTDTFNNKVRKIVIATGVVTTVAGTGTYSTSDAAAFANPRGITTDGVSLYVADTNAVKIRQIR